MVSRKYTFKQNLAGADSLSQQGGIDVTVGAGGTVTEIKAALVRVNPAFTPSMRSTKIADRAAEFDAKAIDLVATKAPGADYKVIKKRIGYDAGNFMGRNQIAPAVAEVTIEAQSGEFKRIFVEKIAL